MAACNIRKLDNSKLMITVRITKEFTVRVWLAMRLVTLAGRLLTGTPGELKICDVDSDDHRRDMPSEDSKKSNRSTESNGIPLSEYQQETFCLFRGRHMTAVHRRACRFCNPKVEPIPMLLFCPKCNLQHVDAPHGSWTNPPHRSHECQGCGYVWRIADVPTTGVIAIDTTGRRDGIARASVRHRA